MASAGSSSSSRRRPWDWATIALRCRPVPGVCRSPSGRSASHCAAAVSRVHWVSIHRALPSRASRLPTRRNSVTRDTPSSSARPCMSSRRPSWIHRAAAATIRAERWPARRAAGRVRLGSGTARGLRRRSPPLFLVAGSCGTTLSTIPAHSGTAPPASACVRLPSLTKGHGMRGSFRERYRSAPTRRSTSSVPSTADTWARSGLRGVPVSRIRMIWEASRIEPG